MAETETEPQSTRRAPLAILAAVLLIAAGITVYIAFAAIRDNEARHAARLNDGVRAAADSIESYLDDRQARVRAFSEKYNLLLGFYAGEPGNEVLRQRIGDALRRDFPGYFTFTIADQEGTDLIDDLDGFVGEICKMSIRDFVGDVRKRGHGGADFRTEIHPQANNYHFDVMAPWTDGDTLKGVFFVSFFPTELRTILSRNQDDDHRLVIIHADRDPLIEVSTLGARDKISMRRDINLTADEVALIKASQDIPGSRWRLVGLTRPGLLARHRADIWFKAGIVISLIVLAGALVYWRLSRTGPA
ncbi:MAG: cache domain-containing protein [Rhodospirillales bacterium]|nr:cache domain-containing protein [Rhodospirillales bacterium]MBO6785259.1 cache domain-containing protein [Rhodospirillales bacterium]